MDVGGTFLANFLLSLAVSLTCAFVVMTLQGWLRTLRGCGGLLTLLLVVAALVLAASLLVLPEG